MTDTDGSPQASERKAPTMVGGNVANLVKRISTELQSKSDVPVRAGSNDVKQRRVKAAFSYTPQNEDELRLDVDDIVEVLGEEEEGWWKGRLKGKVGVFPANFVKPLETSPWPDSRHESDDKPKPDDAGEAHVVGASSGEIQPKKVAGIGFGNIFAGNQKIELRNVKGVGGGGGSAVTAASSTGDVMKRSAEGTTVATPKDSSLPKGAVSNGRKPLPAPVSSASDAVTGSKHKEYAKALFAYDAENDDELSLQEGDIISVLSKEVEDAGWWLGELNGKRGVFPDNFVAAISADEAEKLKKTAGAASVGIGSAAMPPLVPAKPPKPASTATSTALESGRTPLALVSEGKYEIPVASPKQSPLSKLVSDSHCGKTETYVADRTAALPATSSDKDKPNVYKKPMVPLVGMAKPKFNSGGRLLTGSGASSPNSDDKAEDGDTDGVNAVDDKLNHPTASRARNPNRRPPSQAFLKDMAIEPTLAGPVVTTAADESLFLPKNPSDSTSSYEMVNNNGKFRSDSNGEEYVRREEFDKLQASFESFKRETRERIRELEKLLSSSQVAKSQKL